MRSRYLIIADLVRELGGPDKVAQLLAVEDGTVRKYCESPQASGRDMPQEKALVLLRHASNLSGNEPAQALVDEYLAHFGAAGNRKIVRLSALLQVEEALLHLKNGKTYKSVIENCPSCSQPLDLEGRTDNGHFLYRCKNKNCLSKAAHAPAEATS